MTAIIRLLPAGVVFWAVLIVIGGFKAALALVAAMTLAILASAFAFNMGKL